MLFGGWEDVKRQSVINVMIRIDSGMDVTERLPFIVGTEYCGTWRVKAREYVCIIEKVLSQFGLGNRICAITSDNTQACINAREMFASEHPGCFSINDQSHVADLLIENVSELEWIGTVIERVSHIVTIVHSHKKLKARLNECIDE